MKCAFVVRLSPKTNPGARRFEGCVEEVDTGKELRFHSQDELLAFFGERFMAVSNAEGESKRIRNRGEVKSNDDPQE